MRNALSLAIAALALAGCASRLEAAKSAYNAGDYPEAKAKLAMLEKDAPGLPTCRRAEFELYRGLTLLALGDQQSARSSLEKAKTQPTCFEKEDTARLDLALESSK